MRVPMTVVVGLCLLLAVVHSTTSARHPGSAEYLTADAQRKRAAATTPEDNAVSAPTKENIKKVLQEADYVLSQAINNIGETDMEAGVTSEGSGSNNSSDLKNWNIEVSSD